MRLKNVILSLCLLAISIGAIGQSLAPGTVSAIVSLGIYDIAVINETGTSSHYKTGPYTPGSLVQNENVQLDFFPNDPTSAYVTSNNLQEMVIGVLVTNPTGINWTPPELEGDILFFTDEAHYAAYVSQIEVYLTDKEEHDGLDLIEGEFQGFISYRTEFNNEHNWLTETFTEEELDEIYEEDFLHNNIHKTLLSRYREVGIGNKIYYVHEPGVVISFDKTFTEGLTILRGQPEGFDAYNGNIMEEEEFDYVHVDGVVMPLSILVPPTQLGDDYQYRYIADPVVELIPAACQNTYVRLELDFSAERKAIVTSQQGQATNWTNYTNSIGAGTLVVDWGDGPPETFTNYDGQSYVYHTYATGGLKTPKTTFTFTGALGTTRILYDGVGTTGKQFSVTLGAPCTSASKSLVGAKNSGSWRLTAKIWSNNYFLFKDIGSHTHSYKLKNGEWELKRAGYIYTYIFGTYRNNSCTDKGDESGSDNKSNRKTVQKTKHRIFLYYSISNGDVKSTHALTDGSNVSISMNLVLNPC